MSLRAIALAAAALAAGCLPAYAPPGSRDPKFLLERRAAFREASEKGRGLEAAARALAEAVETDRPEAWLLAAEAIECPDLAWRAWKRARRLSPTLADSSRTRAILEARDGRTAAALERAGEAAKSEPDRADLAILASELARRNGRLPEALEGYRGVLARDPGNAAALAGAARVREMLGETGEAATLLARAIEARPDAPLPRYRLRRLAERLRDPAPLAKAEAALARAQAARPGDALLAADRAFLLGALGRRREGLAIYRAACRPEGVEAEHLLDWRLSAVEEGAPSEALRIDESLFGFARSPGDSTAPLRARIAKAARAAEEGEADGWALLGNAFRDAGWLPEAEAALARAASGAPPGADARKALDEVRAVRRFLARLRDFAEEGYRDFSVRGRARDLADLEAFLRREGALPAATRLRPMLYWPVGWVLHDGPEPRDPVGRRLSRWNLYMNAGRRAGGTLEIGVFPVSSVRTRAVPGGRIVPFVASGGRIVDTLDEWRGRAASGGAILAHAVVRPENVHDAVLLDAEEVVALDPGAADPWTIPWPKDFGAGEPSRIGPIGPAPARLLRRALAGVPFDRRKAASLEETEIHESRHLSDAAAVLPFGFHPFRAAWTLAAHGFSGDSILEDLEGRAQLDAVASAPDPRPALARLLEPLPGPGLHPPYSRAYARVAAALVREVLSRPADFPDIDPARNVLLQLERLPPERLREAARAVAERRLGR